MSDRVLSLCLAAATTALWVDAVSRGARADDAVRASDIAASRASSSTTPSAYDNALRLARMLGDDTVVAKLLAERALSPDGTQATRDEAVEALEDIGEPEQAAQLLERHLQGAPDDEDARVALAELWARSGYAARAAEVWADIVGRGTSLSTEQADSYALVLSRLGRTDDALRVLAAASPTAADGARSFWDDLALLAWQHEDDGLALVADRKLWALGDHRGAVAERLVTLAGASGNVGEAVAVAVTAFREDGDAQRLLQAAHLQAHGDDWAGVLHTLGLQGAGRALARDRDYWLLLAEAYEHLGQRAGARGAYRALLAFDPSSIEAKAALLWGAIDDGDTASMRDLASRWGAKASDEPALCAPLAIALDRVGRTREAIPFYARAAASASADPSVLLDFGDALSRAGHAALAFRVRRRAAAELRARAAVAARDPRPSSDERALAEESAALVRDVAGAAAGDRLFRAILAARGAADAKTDAFVAQWCLHDDRFDCARSALAAHGGHADDPEWRGVRLQLALAEDDRATAAALVFDGRPLEPSDRIDALLDLGRDGAAAAAIGDALERGQLDDPDMWRGKLSAIVERHQPSATVGAGYATIAGLNVYGPEASAAHDLGPLRIVYSAAVRDLRVGAGIPLDMTGSLVEVDASALARSQTPRGVMELGAGANGQPGAWLPRATFLAERLLTATTELTLRAGLDDAVDDTALLRLAGAEHRLEVGVRQDLGRGPYVQLDLEGRELHTRRLHHLAWDVGEQIELGYKIVEDEPEWDVGVRALASQTEAVAALPGDVASLVPAAERGDLSGYVPPSYQLVSVVTHLARGDVLRRHRADRTTLPRYDCSAGAGILFPAREPALDFDCAASARVTGLGYASASLSVEQGVFGVAGQTNALASITYTQPF